MDELAKQLERYLGEMLPARVAVAPFAGGQRLPHFLAQLYDLSLLRIGDAAYLAIFLRDQARFKPSALAKHLRQLPLAGVAGCCLVARSLPPYVRKRLMENGIPFVVPASQLYWPALGLAAQARPGWRPPPLAVELLSPATQVVVIHALTGRIETCGVTPGELARALGYTAMTMTRALDELEALGLGEVRRQGRERRLTFPAGRKILWAQARPRMRNPVRQVVRFLETDVPEEFRLLAGESALAARTMLGEPATPVYGVGRNGWRAISGAGAEEIPVEEPGTCALQVWRYEPGLFADHDCVDAFSLSLSLQDEQDERVEAALEEMMEGYAW